MSLYMTVCFHMTGFYCHYVKWAVSASRDAYWLQVKALVLSWLRKDVNIGFIFQCATNTQMKMHESLFLIRFLKQNFMK